MRIIRILILFQAFGLWLSSSGWAQSGGSSDIQEQEKLLELRRSEVLLESARARFEEKQRLAELNLISRSELETARTELLKAEIDYQQSFLSLFSRTPRLSVVEGVKSIASDGSRRVKLVVANSSLVAMDYRRLGILESKVPVADALKLREIENVFVSLKNEEGAIISEPYEIHIDRLKVGEKEEISFELLKDVDVVTVSLSYAGRVEERKVFLKKDASANLVTIQPEQISQEADLGGEAVYPLKLERFTSDGKVFQLLTANLPEQIEAEFRAAESEARLSQILFGEGETTKRIHLRLSLPLMVSREEFALDRPLRFWVVALRPELARSFQEKGAFGLSEQEIERVEAGKARLEITPRGLGKLEVKASNLFQEIEPAETAEFRLSVRNVGTRLLRNVQISTDQLLDWRSAVEPEKIPSLEVNQESGVLVRILPPKQVMIGDYSVRIRVEGTSGNRAVQFDDLSARVRVSSPPNLWFNVLISLLLFFFVLGLVVVGIRIARR